MLETTPPPNRKKGENCKASNTAMYHQSKTESSCTNIVAHLNNYFKAKNVSENSGCYSGRHHGKDGAADECRLSSEWFWCKTQALLLASAYTVPATLYLFPYAYIYICKARDRSNGPHSDGHRYLKRRSNSIFPFFIWLQAPKAEISFYYFQAANGCIELTPKWVL